MKLYNLIYYVSLVSLIPICISTLLALCRNNKLKLCKNAAISFFLSFICFQAVIVRAVGLFYNMFEVNYGPRIEIETLTYRLDTIKGQLMLVYALSMLHFVLALLSIVRVWWTSFKTQEVQKYESSVRNK